MAFNPERAPQVEQMVKDSWRETMIEIEKLAATRVHKGGADYDRVTGELAYIGITHRDARH
jgi:hypothetical protein